jgi:tyrosyl-tRNA synthetase
MGKTESGTIWLSADRTSPYQFYQYWINVADDDVGKCLRFLTDLSLEEIGALDEARQTHPEKRESQRKLAEALTQLVHGSEQLAVAQKATEFFFGAEIADMRDEQLSDVFADVPSQQVPAADLGGAGMGLIDALSTAGLVQSKGEARRVIKEGGAYINNRRCTDIAARLTSTDLASETMVVLRRGKKRYALLQFVDS